MKLKQCKKNEEENIASGKKQALITWGNYHKSK